MNIFNNGCHYSGYLIMKGIIGTQSLNCDLIHTRFWKQYIPKPESTWHHRTTLFLSLKDKPNSYFFNFFIFFSLSVFPIACPLQFVIQKVKLLIKR